MPELSLIVPVFNEADNILSLSDLIRKSLVGIDYELIWVNDGSTDKTEATIIEQCDECSFVISFDKNYGQSAAMQAGIDHASGKYIGFIDGDGQNDPTDIPRMLRLFEKNRCDMVVGHRADRKDGFLLRKLPSRIANKLIRLTFGVKVRDYGCTLKLIKHETAKQLVLEKGYHRFIPVLVARLGGSISETKVLHNPRINGKSNYGIERTFKVIRDLVKIYRNKDTRQRGKNIYEVCNYYPNREAFKQDKLRVQAV